MTASFKQSVKSTAMGPTQPHQLLLLLCLFSSMAGARPLSSTISANVPIGNKEFPTPQVRSPVLDQASPRLSYAEIGGITAGAVAGTIVVASLFYLLLLRRRKSKSAQSKASPQPPKDDEHKSHTINSSPHRKRGRQQRQQRREQYKKAGRQQTPSSSPTADKTALRSSAGKGQRSQQASTTVNKEHGRRRKSRIPVSSASQTQRRRQALRNRNIGEKRDPERRHPSDGAVRTKRHERSAGGERTTNHITTDAPENHPLHTRKPTLATANNVMDKARGRETVVAEGKEDEEEGEGYRPHPIASYQRHSREQWIQAGAEGRAMGGFPRGEDGAVWI